VHAHCPALLTLAVQGYAMAALLLLLLLGLLLL
jgi:hypothetical protein